MQRRVKELLDQKELSEEQEKAIQELISSTERVQMDSSSDDDNQEPVVESPPRAPAKASSQRKPSTKKCAKESINSEPTSSASNNKRGRLQKNMQNNAVDHQEIDHQEMQAKSPAGKRSKNNAAKASSVVDPPSVVPTDLIHAQLKEMLETIAELKEDKRRSEAEAVVKAKQAAKEEAAKAKERAREKVQWEKLLADKERADAQIKKLQEQVLASQQAQQDKTNNATQGLQAEFSFMPPSNVPSASFPSFPSFPTSPNSSSIFVQAMVQNNINNSLYSQQLQANNMNFMTAVALSNARSNCKK